MSFRALLVTKDNQAANALAPVLLDCGLAASNCGYSDGLCLVTEQKFQLVLVDFDDPHSATLVLQNLGSAPFQTHAITVALLSDKNKVRNAFGAGANFAIYKPIEVGQATDTLRAATALMKRERRNSFRVPIQVAVMLSLPNDDHTPGIEGILLDLSETGMDVLSSQPMHPAALLRARFTLPNSPSEFEVHGSVAWANPNGETGVQFDQTPENLRAALHQWLTENSKAALPEEPEPVSNCKLTDLSLGACYVETTSPFPEHTFIELILRAEGVELKAPGVVRVMHPSHGMGVEFLVQTEDQRQQAEEFIRFLTTNPGVRPELLVSPEKIAPAQDASLWHPEEVEDALLDLLRNHRSFTEEAFLQALSSQRGGELVKSEQES